MYKPQAWIWNPSINVIIAFVHILLIKTFKAVNTDGSKILKATRVTQEKN